MKKLVLILVLLIPIAAFARFEKLVTDVNDVFGKISGVVVSADGSSVYTDLGRDKGVYDGMVLKVYRNSEQIVHPLTGQVLGFKKIYIGDLTITDVQDKLSVGTLTTQQRQPQAGDQVVLNPPVEVSLNVDGMPARLSGLLKEELGGANNIIIKGKARLSLVFTQKKEGGIDYTVTDNTAHKALVSRFYADTDQEAGNTNEAVKDIVTSKPLDKTYKSMAVGHVKKDGKMYIVLATKDSVDFYTFDGKTFDPAGTMGAKINGEIENVETADINGNGTDEIFVTAVLDTYNVRSYAYEYDGKQFKMVADNLPYVLRTIYDKGKKRIVSQRLAQDGTYLGGVQELTWTNGDYARGETLSPSRDISIYGFGASDIDGDGKKDVFDINDGYNIDVYVDNAKKYTSPEQFGQTPYYFTITNETEQKFKTTDEGSDPFVKEKLKKYIKGRIFVNSDGNLYVVQNNEKYKMLERTKIYGSSSFAIFTWDGRRLRQKWISEVFQPTIADYFMYEEYGRTYMFLLRNFSEGMFSSDKSELIYIETK